MSEEIILLNNKIKEECFNHFMVFEKNPDMVKAELLYQLLKDILEIPSRLYETTDNDKAKLYFAAMSCLLGIEHGKDFISAVASDHRNEEFDFAFITLIKIDKELSKEVLKTLINNNIDNENINFLEFIISYASDLKVDLPTEFKVKLQKLPYTILSLTSQGILRKNFGF